MISFDGFEVTDTLIMANTSGESSAYTVPPWNGRCQVCHERPGTELVHGCPGGTTHECRQCIVEAQLKGARESAARIPALEAELASLMKRDPAKGSINTWVVALALFGLAFITGLVAFEAFAHADTPITKCWTSVCVGPEVSVSVLALTFPGRHIEAGLLPVGSIGYGAHSVGDWWAAGIYLSARAGGGQPGYLAPAVLMRLFRAFTVGGQMYYGEDVTRWSLLVGGGFGL